ncbi:MAG TPA: riboflavin synthase [Chitinophagaceae bacterium]|nr:riboflavin synthase [Chitinophagaceae bacterium]
MFTGIIEAEGIIKDVISNGSNKTIWVESPVSHKLKIDQSVSHNGVCLTVEEIKDDRHCVTIIEETLQKTNLGNCKVSDRLNIERSLLLNNRLDGHLVQGHVDTIAICTKKEEKKGSWEFEFEFPKKFTALIIEKGAVCINGISLTCFNTKKKKFSVAVIPYTFEHTNMKNVFPGHSVNIEFDLLGKYILRMLKKNIP